MPTTYSVRTWFEVEVDDGQLATATTVVVVIRTAVVVVHGAHSAAHSAAATAGSVVVVLTVLCAAAVPVLAWVQFKTVCWGEITIYDGTKYELAQVFKNAITISQRQSRHR